MTNEVATTKSLLNLISKNNDETIFRAIAIHFGKLVNNSSEIDSELIHKLNDIYYKYVESSDYSLFSEEISICWKNRQKSGTNAETRRKYEEKQCKAVKIRKKMIDRLWFALYNINRK